MLEQSPRPSISPNGDGSPVEKPAVVRPKPEPAPTSARQPAVAAAPADEQRPAIPYVSPQELARWAVPSVTLLAESPPGSHEPGIDKEATSELIENTLADYGIEVSVSEVKPGPVVTMFGLVPGWVRRNRQSKGRGDGGDQSTRTERGQLDARDDRQNPVAGEGPGVGARGP